MKSLKTPLTIFLAYLLVFSMPIAKAAPDDALYTAEIPVSTQSTEERTQALPKALEQVFIKVSGNQAIAEQKPIQESMKKAANWLQEYSYQDAGTEAEKGATKPGLILRVRFDPEPINKQLQALGGPVWSKSRPLVLVWLDFEATQDNPTIVNSESNPQMSAQVVSASEQRGISLIFPALDLEDYSTLTVNDVQHFNLAAIEKTSARYRSGALLVGRVWQSNPNTWSGHWTLSINGQPQSWDNTGATTTEVMAAAVNDLADKLAKQQTVVNQPNANQKSVVMTVSKVTNATGYASVLAYLRGLSQISAVEVTRVDRQQLVLALELNSDLQTLQQALAHDHLLSPVSDTNPSSKNLNYQWSP